MLIRAFALVSLGLIVTGCGKQEATPTAAPAPKRVAAEQSLPEDPNNVVNIAIGSKDHTTLVAALKAAEYVYSVSNPGPLTVFAPTNAGFDALPPGTVESLVTPEKQEDLRNILKYHVSTSVYDATNLKDGQTLSMANGKKTKIGLVDGKLTINGVPVVASIRGTNGIIHVINSVLLPPAE